MASNKPAAIIIVSVMVVCAIPIILFSEARQANIQQWVAGDWIEQRKAVAALVTEMDLNTDERREFVDRYAARLRAGIPVVDIDFARPAD